MDQSEGVKEEKEEEEYEPSLNIRRNLKKMENQNRSVHRMQEISESYAYESESMGLRNRRSQEIYEDPIKREDNDLDF